MTLPSLIGDSEIGHNVLCPYRLFGSHLDHLAVAIHHTCHSEGALVTTDTAPDGRCRGESRMYKTGLFATLRVTKERKRKCYNKLKKNMKSRISIRFVIPPRMSWHRQCWNCSPKPSTRSVLRSKMVSIMTSTCRATSRRKISNRSKSACGRLCRPNMSSRKRFS